MRNLKRALSLTLASVMLLGMMVFGTSAVSYSDADSIDNVEAAEVLNAVKVMQGNNGKFSPNQTVTRGQMAIIVIKMLYGDKVNVSQFAGASEFTDVPANAYYTGYVNMASSLGIISGYGDGRFGPGAPVNTAQAAAMLCRALGYFKNPAENASGWALASITRASSLGMFGDLTLNTYDPLSRDNVAEMVFNAMTKTTPVDYNENFNLYYTKNTSWTTGVRQIKEEDVGKSATNYQYSLGYDIFKLTTSGDNETFGRPGAYTWNIDGKPATSVFSATADLMGTYTAKMTYGDLYSTLGKTVVDNLGTVDVYVDNQQVVKSGTSAAGSIDTSRLTRNQKDAFEYEGTNTNFASGSDKHTPTGNGIITEVYSTSNKTTNKYDVTIVIINTYVAEVTADYDAKNERLTIAPKGTPYGISFNTQIKSEDVAGLENFKEKDIVTVTAAYDGANYKVQSVKAPTLVSDRKVTSYTAGSNVTFDGKTYKYNAGARGMNTSYDVINSKGYDFYLDENDYVVFADGAAGATEYVYIDAQEKQGNSVTGNYVLAKAVFTDGTKQNIEITKLGGNDAVNGGSSLVASNKWYTYTVNGDGKYELTAVATADAKTLSAGTYKSDTPLLTTGAVANSDTVFVIYNSTTKAYTVYTGIASLPTMNNASGEAVVTNGYADYVYLAAAGSDISSGVTAQTAYILKTSYDRGYDSAAKKTTYTYDAIVDGEVGKITLIDSISKAGLYYWENTSNGYPSGLNLVDSNTGKYGGQLVDNKAVTFRGGSLVVDDKNYTVNSDADVFTIKADGSAEATTLTAVANDGNFTGMIYLVSVSSTDSKKVAVYFQKGSIAGMAESIKAAPDQTVATQTTAAKTTTLPTPTEKSGTIKITGAVKPGVQSDDSGATSMMGSPAVSGTKNYTVVKFVIPAHCAGSDVALRQTNDALAVYYASDPTVGSSAGVASNQKFKLYNSTTGMALSSGTEFYFMVLVGKTVTLEFDVSGCTSVSNFSADYTYVIDGTGLSVVSGS